VLLAGETSSAPGRWILKALQAQMHGNEQSAALARRLRWQAKGAAQGFAAPS
jgi:hypothetical protein